MQQLPMPELPTAPLLALAGCWNLLHGEHPSLYAPLAEVLPQLPLFPTLNQWQQISALGLPLTLASHGHHVLRDGGPHGVTTFLLGPVFVRDLCGRVIHTGLNPLPTPPAGPTFPAGCADVPASMGGAAYLENAIFSHALLLEPRPADIHSPISASSPGFMLQSGYANPGAYPYKIRPQTFYADGWRLPQLNRVYARTVPGAAEVATQLMQQWANRPTGQDYEAFYEALGGSAKIEDLFLQGVTVIPTFEAYNGAFQVAEDFSVLGVEAGHAVAGLHHVVGQEASGLPNGTILKVLAPGFVTAHHIEPAQVVTSSGPSLTPTDALLPNFSLPHPHTSPVWGACWLPTQPQHFAAPALWDWQANGHFAQTAGPLWCPSHYVYASTGPLIQSFRRPLPDCPSLFSLPATLKDKFSPAIALSRYDTLNERTKTERLAQNGLADSPLFGSALDALPLGQEVAPLGYHMLPSHWPTLRQSAHFPEPTGPTLCPPELAPRLAPLASPTTAGPNHSQHHVITSKPLGALLTACANATDAPYPDWLPAMSSSQLQLNVKRLFANRSYRNALNTMHAKLPEALFRFKENTLAWRRLRYRLVSKYPAVWLEAERRHISLQMAEDLTGVVPDTAHTEARAQILAQSGCTKVPARFAPALHNGLKPAKLK